MDKEKCQDFGSEKFRKKVIIPVGIRVFFYESF